VVGTFGTDCMSMRPMSSPLFPLACVVIVEYDREPLGAMFGVVFDDCELSLSCITFGRFACAPLSPLTTYKPLVAGGYMVRRSTLHPQSRCPG
jgi:hypothetical protein